MSRTAPTTTVLAHCTRRSAPPVVNVAGKLRSASCRLVASAGAVSAVERSTRQLPGLCSVGPGLCDAALSQKLHVAQMGMSDCSFPRKMSTRLELGQNRRFAHVADAGVKFCAKILIGEGLRLAKAAQVVAARAATACEVVTGIKLASVPRLRGSVQRPILIRPPILRRMHASWLL